MPKARPIKKKTKTAPKRVTKPQAAPSTKPLAFPEKFYQDPLGIDRYVVQEKILFEWRAPSKMERMRTPAEKTQLLMVVLFCIIITLLLGELWVAVVFATLAGLYVIMMNTQPTYFECSVTTLGVKVVNKYYFWPDISQFWFEEHRGGKVLYLRVVFPTVHNMRLIIHPSDEEQLRTIIGMYLLFKKPQQTNAQLLLKSFSEKLPIDLEFLQL